jgi:hypothetical protein
MPASSADPSPEIRKLLRAAINVVEGEERALDSPEDLTTEAAAQINFYAHRGQDKSKAC